MHVHSVKYSRNLSQTSVHTTKENITRNLINLSLLTKRSCSKDVISWAWRKKSHYVIQSKGVKNKNKVALILNHLYISRSRGTLRSTREIIKFYQKSLCHTGPRIWDTLPCNMRYIIKNSTSKIEQKQDLLSLCEKL